MNDCMCIPCMYVYVCRRETETEIETELEKARRLELKETVFLVADLSEEGRDPPLIRFPLLSHGSNCIPAYAFFVSISLLST
mgnify:CR=1 FL=1